MFLYFVLKSYKIGETAQQIIRRLIFYDAIDEVVVSNSRWFSLNY